MSMMSGHGVYVPPGQVGDPWDYLEPALLRPAPCRNIPVTAAMREKDALQQRERRLQPSDWKLGEELRNRKPPQDGCGRL